MTGITSHVPANLTRRGFVAGAAVSAAAVGVGVPAAEAQQAAASGGNGMLIPSCEEFEGYEPPAGTVAFVADPIPDDQIVQSYDVDVVVCGAGWAGCCTAAAAAEGGAKVALLQKLSVPLCNGYEVSCPNSSVHKEHGVQIDTEAYVSDIMQAAQWRASEGVIRRFINRAPEALDWLLSIVGDKLSSEPTPCFEDNIVVAGVNWYASAVDFMADQCVGLLPMLIEHGESFGMDVYYETPACQLVQDADGRVVGVVARNADGQYVKFNAVKGVVLATGGYEYNWEKLKRCCSPRDLQTGSWMNVCSQNTGDGHEMGLAVGGIEDEYPHCFGTDPSGSLVTHIGFSAAMFPLMRVNDQGARFVNEGIPFNFLANAVSAQFGAHDWVLADGNIMESAAQIRPSTCPYSVEQTVEGFLDGAISADTVEELAGIMGVDAAALQASIDRYNELIELGVDEDFGVPIESMTPVKEPPFYAFEEGTLIMNTENGLQIDTDGGVLSRDTKRAIPGLYAVGTCSGSKFHGGYPHNCSGVNLGAGMTYGMIIGRILSGVEEPLNK